MERRTQAERSATTRGALTAAAIELLMERGWAATTAVAVCDRAGVTRGALIHHYPNLSALLADAIDTLHETFTAGPRPRATSMIGLIDNSWAVLGDPRFKAVLEAWSAAGNDPELAVELRPVITRFAKLVSPENSGLPAQLREPQAQAYVFMAREAMLGLAHGRAMNGLAPLPHEPVVLARLRAEAHAIDSSLDSSVLTSGSGDPR